MNCKPGDLAVIVRFNPAHPHLTGRIVEVIEAAPAGVQFRLPDGKMHHPCSPKGWIVLFQNPVDMTAVRGRANGPMRSVRTSPYARCAILERMQSTRRRCAFLRRAWKHKSRHLERQFRHDHRPH